MRKEFAEGHKLDTNKPQTHTISFAKTFISQKQPRIFELSLLFIEYLQLFSQIVLFTTKGTLSGSVSNTVSGYIIRATDIINFSYYLGKNKWGFSEVTLILLCCYILIVYALILYIFIAKAKEIPPNQAIVSFVRIVIQVHGRVVSYYILMCALGWLKTNFTDLDEDTGSFNVAFGAISIVLILLNYILPLYMWTFYSYRLPSKSILAASSYAIEKITLSQKTFHGILFLVVPTQHNMSGWFRWAYNLTIGLIRIREFFIRFPNYDFQAQFLKGALIVVAPTMNICLLIFNIQALAKDEPLDLVSWILTCVLVVLLVEIIYVSIYRKEISNILLKPFKYLSQYKLIHKAQYLKQIKEGGTIFTAAGSKDKIWRRALISLDVGKEESCQGIQDIEGVEFLEDSANFKQLYLKSLQESLLKYPKSESLRLYCAYYFGKKLGLYSSSMKLIESFEKSTWQSSMKLSALMFKVELQTALKAKQKEDMQNLDIAKYVSITMKVKKLKQKMLEQADLQSEIYKEWDMEKFDAGKIEQLSRKVELVRSQIATKIKHLEEQSPDFYLEPLLLCAYYAVQVNFSTNDYSKFIRLHTQRFQRFESKILENDLTRESLYAPNNVELVLSTDRANSGAIVSCGPNIYKILGMKPNLMIGKAFSSLGPPSFAKTYQEMINKASNPDDEMGSIGGVSTVFMSHSNGHVISANSHISLYPLLQSGVFLHVMIRPIANAKEYIIVNKDGYIESYTQGVARELNLAISKMEKAHIGRLNKEFVSANMAMNTAMTTNMEKFMKEQQDMSMELQSMNSVQDRSNVMTENELNTPGVRKQTKRKTQRTLTIQKFQHIYQKYLRKGECLDLFPLIRTKLGDKTPLSPVKDRSGRIGIGIKYNCRVENRKYGENVVKVFILEKVKPGDLENDNNSQIQKKKTGKYTEVEVDKSTKGEQILEAKTPTEQIEGESNISGDFDTEDEKAEEEKIGDDFEDLKIPKQDTQLETIASPKAPLMLFTSPRATEGGLLTTENGGLLKFSLQDHDLGGEKRPQFIQFERRSKAFNTIHSYHVGESKKNEKYDIIEPIGSTGTTRTKADEKRIYSSLRNSLDTKYYSARINTFIWIRYIFIALFIASQLATSFDSQSQFQQLSKNKDVLVNAELRMDLIIRVNRRFRVLATIPMGAMTTAQMSSAVPGGQNAFITLATSELAQLVVANQNLLQDSSSLDAKERDPMFENNVKVFSSGGMVYSPTDMYDVLNTFQATIRLIDLGLRALPLSKTNITEALPTYYLIGRNTLDDMLVQSKENINAVSTLLDNSHDSIVLQTKVVLAVIIFMLGILMIFSGLFLRKLYLRETDILHSISTIDSDAIKMLAKEMSWFKANISEEIYYEEDNTDYMSDYSANLLRLERSAHSKKKREKPIKTTKVVVKYGKYLLRLSIFFLYMVVYVAVDRILLSESTANLYAQVQKIKFIKSIQEEASLLPAGFVEIVLSNATSTIENQNCLDFYNSHVLRFNSLKDQVVSALKNTDNTLDPFIEEALSENGCSLLTGTLVTSCIKLSAGSQEYGMIGFMTALENSFRFTIQQFLNSNRTILDGGAALLATMGTGVPIGNILVGLNNAIASYVTTKFASGITTHSHQNTILNAIGITVLVIFSGLLWVLVLKQLRECDNHLKKVLKNFPVNLSLNSSKLRVFIFETSNNTLGSLKDKV